MRRAWFMAACLAAAGAATPALSADTAGPQLVRVEPPRDSARHLGDVLRYRALVRWPDGWEIDRDGLPTGDREGQPLTLRSHGTEPASPADGCAGCRWLNLDWQVFKAVRITEDVPLPATSVRLRQGSRITTLALPAASVAVSPLVPWERRRDWLDSARPGWQATPYDVAAHAWQAGGLVAAAMVAALAWAWSSGRWLPRAHRRPFAQAWRAVRARHRGQDAAAPADMEDLRLWHRAFDATAGRALMPADLDAFFAERPGFAPLAGECRTMFAASQRVFFLEAPTLVRADDLSALLCRLAAAEFGRAPAPASARIASQPPAPEAAA